jgi:hypothetical protein
MTKLSIDGYLTQEKLALALKSVIDPSDWIGTETPVIKGRRFRWDMQAKIGGEVVAVEFDGHSHYCDSMRIKVDHEKEHIAASVGCRVIRIPYWVQLTTQTVAHYFGIEAAIEQDFPHGFISSNIVFPASYCGLGLQKFRSELTSLPAEVRIQVAKSLSVRCAEHGSEYVMPVGVTPGDII